MTYSLIKKKKGSQLQITLHSFSIQKTYNIFLKRFDEKWTNVPDLTGAVCFYRRIVRGKECKIVHERIVQVSETERGPVLQGDYAR